ncbi:uncharacterized protein LY89DRAFT_319997 [Mollisia scopiformis]|uniref:Uncharacterized protein n=1 Tax=Mollisia scopiformis TaxID=149040 RepID=A0A132B9L8_MOLSC|nr:uncharacterized protein LY89DRAFT_319997 [Mollisia scopiformis]KUJ09100.1 hypothetical protein LY89DRAFT_319997 [Mollisia scopiformis]
MENPVIQQLRQELQVECLAREKAEQTLDVKTSELNTIRTNWTTTARELDQLRVSTAPKSLILTDDHLRDKLALLRYQTRNLAILYFDGDLTQAAKANPTSLLDPYLKPTTPGTNTYEILLNSSNAAQKVVRAYIWRVLVGEVFGQFLWAGDIGQHMAVIGSLLRPSGDPPDPVAERKFALWSNDTTQILLDALGLRIEAEGHDVRYATPRVKTLVSLILETISPFLREKEGQLQTTLLEIVDAAIKLDKEMCQQITRLTWVFGDMEAGTVVLAPGLKRRGRSDGKEFETEKVVLIKEISLEPGLKMGKVG